MLIKVVCSLGFCYIDGSRRLHYAHMRTMMVPVLVHSSNIHLLPSELDAIFAATEILRRIEGLLQQNVAFRLLFSVIS